MLRWPIRSALYIDYENIPLPPEAIANWLAWLEDGRFDAGRQPRRRRFLQKRVYWNSTGERLRPTFEAHGFAAILIDKYAGLKNGADIRMAMDLVEATYTRSEIDEYVLLTSDSDFVPVLVRLREKAKRSIVVANENSPTIHTTYGIYADGLIPTRRLAEASQYERPRGLIRRWRLARAALPENGPPGEQRQQPPAGQARGAAGKAPAKHQTAPAKPGPATPPSVETELLLDEAAGRVATLLAASPGAIIGQKRVMAALRTMQGFEVRGMPTFFGHASYRALMRVLARREDRIRIVGQSSGGIAVTYRPPESADAPSNSGTASAPVAAVTHSGSPRGDEKETERPFPQGGQADDASERPTQRAVAGDRPEKAVTPDAQATTLQTHQHAGGPESQDGKPHDQPEESAETSERIELTGAGHPPWQRDRAAEVREA